MGDPMGDEATTRAGRLATADAGCRALWSQLDGFEIDEGPAQFGFADRLARDNGWTRAYADRVIAEYRRFLFLGQVAGHPVTPSDEVDQAWHLHLTYTRSYWDDLCGRVLGRPFHHGPTLGGAAEGAKFDDWYGRTRSSYRAWFGHEAPADIWPDPEIRFGEAPHYRRVNTRRLWLVPKPAGIGEVTGGRATGRSVVMTASMVALAGCSGVGVVNLLATGNDVAGGGGGSVVAVVIGLVVVAGLLVLFTRGRSSGSKAARRRRDRSDDGAFLLGTSAWDDDSDSDTGSDSGGDSGCGGSGCGGCGGCGS